MKKNEKKQKRKTAPTFEMALKTGILPNYMQLWSPERLQAVKELYEAITEKRDADNGKIIVAGVPCGGGKSSLLKGLAVMAAERMLSLVMMTDNNQRLHDDIEDAIKSIGGIEWAQVEKNIAWLSDGDTVTAGEWRSVMLSSLVALSTQRYLMVNDDVRKNACTTYIMGQQSIKDVLICDEAFQDVDEHMCYYSDVKQFSGILHESIRPDREWESNIGETAKRAEKYADKLISDLLTEIDRINKIKLPAPKNGSAPEGQMHIDLYLGREERVEKSEKIWREKWLEILPIVTDIRDDIKAVKKDLRSVSENRLFSGLQKIQKSMENMSEKTRPETILSTLEELLKLTELLPIGGVRAGLREMTRTCLDNAENYFALSELEKIIRNNRDNMYGNSEHVRDRSITAEQFLDIFRSDNVIFLQASNYGDDKEGDLTGQIKIHVFRYNIKYLPYDKMPCYLFDGTGGINPMYDNKDIFEVRQYEKPKTHVGFVQLDEKMSKTFLQDGRNIDRLYERVSDFLLETYGPQNLNSRKIMISGFKAAGKNAAEYGLAWPDGYIPEGRERYPILHNPQTGMYGPISQHPYATYGSSYCTGSNIYKDCSLLCKISVLRLKQTTVLGQICCRDHRFLENLKSMDESYRARQLQLIFAFGADRSDFADVIEDVTLRTAMADVIQEINRLRIRNWCDNPADADKYDITVIWTLRGRKQGEYDQQDEDFYEKLMRRVMEYFGSNPADKNDYRYIPSKLHPRRKSTEKQGTLMCKISDWWEALPDGKEFTLSDMAAGVGVNKRVLNATLRKEQNTHFLHLLQGEDNCNVRKSGTCYIYRKPAKEREPEYIQETLDFAKMM